MTLQALAREVLTLKRRSAVAALLILWFFTALSFPGPTRSAEVSPVADPEVRHLLGYIEGSGCQFCRNGTWYQDTKAVRKHVETKYGYFVKKGQITSTEDFIKRSASKSEMSGKPYLVKCGNGAPLFLAQWLSDELERYRRENR